MVELSYTNSELVTLTGYYVSIVFFKQVHRIELLLEVLHSFAFSQV